MRDGAILCWESNLRESADERRPRTWSLRLGEESTHITVNSGIRTAAKVRVCVVKRYSRRVLCYNSL